MNKFNRSAKREYTVITPLSPLEDLEAFLEDNLFALGASVIFVSHLIWTIDVLVPVGTVTDSERKFVLAVATQQDLDVRPIFASVTKIQLLTTPLCAELRDTTRSQFLIIVTSFNPVPVLNSFPYR